MELDKKTKETISQVEQYYGVTLKDMCVPNTQKYPDATARDMLCYILRENGLKHREIAEIFDISLRNVFFRIHKTLCGLSYKGKLFQDYQEISNNLKNN